MQYAMKGVTVLKIKKRRGLPLKPSRSGSQQSHEEVDDQANDEDKWQ